MNDDLKEWQERRDRINTTVMSIPETEAMDWLHALRRRFGWAGTMFTDEDIRTRWDEMNQDAITGEFRDGHTPLTDEQVDSIMSTYYWSKGLQDSLTENGWVVLDMAIEEIMG